MVTTLESGSGRSGENGKETEELQPQGHPWAILLVADHGVVARTKLDLHTTEVLDFSIQNQFITDVEHASEIKSPESVGIGDTCYVNAELVRGESFTRGDINLYQQFKNDPNAIIALFTKDGKTYSIRKEQDGNIVLYQNEQSENKKSGDATKTHFRRKQNFIGTIPSETTLNAINWNGDIHIRTQEQTLIPYAPHHPLNQTTLPVEIATMLVMHPNQHIRAKNHNEFKAMKMPFGIFDPVGFTRQGILIDDATLHVPAQIQLVSSYGRYAIPRLPSEDLIEISRKFNGRIHAIANLSRSVSEQMEILGEDVRAEVVQGLLKTILDTITEEDKGIFEFIQTVLTKGISPTDAMQFIIGAIAALHNPIPLLLLLVNHFGPKVLGFVKDIIVGITADEILEHLDNQQPPGDHKGDKLTDPTVKDEEIVEELPIKTAVKQITNFLQTIGVEGQPLVYKTIPMIQKLSEEQQTMLLRAIQFVNDSFILPGEQLVTQEYKNFAVNGDRALHHMVELLSATNTREKLLWFFGNSSLYLEVQNPETVGRIGLENWLKLCYQKTKPNRLFSSTQEGKVLQHERQITIFTKILFDDYTRSVQTLPQIPPGRRSVLDLPEIPN